MIEQKKIIELKSGEQVDHFFILAKIEERTTKNNKPFLNLELRDKSSSINAKVWDNFQQFKSEAAAGKVIKVNGQVEDYMGNLQIKVNLIRVAKANDKVSIQNFLPKSSRDLQTMLREFDNRINRIGNSYLKELLNKILNGDKFEEYKQVPAGKAWHHAYIHGLLEHTLELIKICDLMCDIHPEINRDLLITGAVLHDFGKTEELSYNTNFDYTDKGKLIGHIVIAAMEIEKTALTIKGFPGDLKDQLIHLVLSHQGKYEFASPVIPKTLEAIVLYHADELSAKTNAYKNAIKIDENKEGNWTKYLPLAETALFIPPKKEENNKQDSLFDN